MDQNERILLRVEEVAEMLRLGRSKTYELIAQGVLPGVRFGRAVRVPAEALRRWLDNHCTHREY
jgi:excisionase family DNA binding protein